MKNITKQDKLLLTHLYQKKVIFIESYLKNISNKSNVIPHYWLPNWSSKQIHRKITNKKKYPFLYKFENRLLNCKTNNRSITC